MPAVHRFGSKQCASVGDPQQLLAIVFSRPSAGKPRNHQNKNLDHHHDLNIIIVIILEIQSYED
jgi:hypothetical protein